jgi:CRP-like cAMP-binding protein
VAPLIKRYYGPGKRPPVELSRYAAVLSAGALPIEVEPARVWEEVQEEFLAAGQSSSFLEGLSDRAIKQLTSKGFIVDVPEGTLVTHEGFGEKEMFVILDGIFEALVQDRRLAVMGKGEVIGEVAFFRESGRRSASVRATTAGRVLALRRRFLEELMKDDPALAAQLLFNLARIMSERLARQSSVQQVEPPAEVFLEEQE